MTFMDFPGAPNSTVVGTVDTNAGTGTLTSGLTPFFGHAWTGTVVFGFETTGAGTWNYSGASGASATGTYNFILAPGQVAMGVLFDWGTSSGIPILNIMNADGSGVDIDGDGTIGTTMTEGPFAGASVGFAGKPVIPLPEIVIAIPGGSSQECDAENGSNVLFDTNIVVSDPGEIESILWFLDGGNTAVGNGESAEIFVPLGTHTIKVTMNTLTMGSVSGTTEIVVKDSTAPVISAGFVDARTGSPVTSVSRRANVKVLVNANDDCDPEPMTMSVIGIPLEDSDSIGIKTNRKKSSITLTAPSDTVDAMLRVVSTDATGNTAVETVLLPVTLDSQQRHKNKRRRD